ncbi:hypothetical protein M3J09_000537 [Ascochyta lentis]
MYLMWMLRTALRPSRYENACTRDRSTAQHGTLKTGRHWNKLQV